jgi:hypothetical protein
MKRHGAVWCFWATVAAAACEFAHAQSWAPSTTTSVFTRQVWAEASARHMWRGLDAGRSAFRLGAARSWGEAHAGSATVLLSGEAVRAFADRADMSDVVGAGSTVIYRLSDDDTFIWATADVLHLPNAAGQRTTTQFAAGAQMLLPIWLPERRPFIIVEGRRDLQRWNATYARTGLRLDYKFKPQYSATIDAGHAWSGLPRGGLAGSQQFATHGTDVTLTVLQQATTRSGTRSLEPFVSAIWSGRNADRVTINAGLRIVFTR